MTIDLSLFRTIKVLVIGDLMIDEYLWGDVDRISPEAPVPIVTVNRQTTHTLGGAGNVINNLVAMGAKVSVIGTVGTDQTAELMLGKLGDLGVNTSGIVSEPGRPTTLKTRVIASNQQVLRIDRETRKEISTNTLAELFTKIEALVPEMDIVLISDYGKGLLTRDLLSKTINNCNQSNTRCIVDPKGLDFTKYRRATLLTPNQKEAGLAAGIDIISDRDMDDAAIKIMETAEVGRLLITCGKDGMVGFKDGKRQFTIKSKARQVFDVSGAGDTVISLIGLGLASFYDFQISAEIANAAAGIVVGKIGTATASFEELEGALLEMFRKDK